MSRGELLVHEKGDVNRCQAGLNEVFFAGEVGDCTPSSRPGPYAQNLRGKTYGANEQ